MKNILDGVLLVSACALLAAAPLVAQQHGTDAVQLEQGARVYMSTCSACHGPTGDQISGVALASGQYRHATTDDELAHVITSGIPGTMMPPNNLNARDLPALVAYLHAMKDFNTKKVALGDPARGQAIFEGKGQCLESALCRSGRRRS